MLESLLGSSCFCKIIVFLPLNFGFTQYLFLSLFSSQGTFPSGRDLVGSNGLEPSTSRLSGVRSNHLSYEPMSSFSFDVGSHTLPGGDERDRTVDPLLAKQVLSQLSYTPIFSYGKVLHLFDFECSREFPRLRNTQN